MECCGIRIMYNGSSFLLFRVVELSLLFDPTQKQYGWNAQQLQKPVAGREGSDITKFAAELVKNGIFY